MKVVFFGTPQFAADVLTYLLQNRVNVVAVVTKPDRAKGRSSALQPTPVKQVAESRQIPVFQPEIVSIPDFAPTLAAFDADLFVVVAYGEIIKEHLLKMPKLGCINLHASLLPAYRGAAPIQHAIMHGEKETGVTIIHMAKKMDAGDMIDMVKVPIDVNDTFPVVEQAVLKEGAKLLLDVIFRFARGEIKEIVQEHSKATFAPKIELETCEIDWSRPAEEIHNLIRAVTPEPGAWCYASVRGQKKRLKILKASLSDKQGLPGYILEGKNALTVGCGNGAVKILDLQLEGKKRMSAEELMRGLAVKDLIFYQA